MVAIDKEAMADLVEEFLEIGLLPFMEVKGISLVVVEAVDMEI